MYNTILVVDKIDPLLNDEHLTIITFEQYLSDYPKKNETKTRVINLCDTEQYLSRGYYCSLLAEARKHKILPTVSTINDLRHIASDTQSGLVLPVSSELGKLVTIDSSVNLLIIFGSVEQEPWKKIARQIFDKYPAPILQVQISRNSNGLHIQLKAVAWEQLDPQQREQFIQRLQSFTQLSWARKSLQRQARWDMAILVNPEEKNPPSDKAAIRLFIKAAEKVGIHAEVITPQQESQITQYDALFIRETTAIDHHTYRMARKAEREGLVVIDDSTSILRCCNKVFLHDAFSYNKVPSLKTRVVIDSSEPSLEAIEQEFSYPLVLKMPEGSFSHGVFKVDDRAELIEKLDELFKSSALVLAQEYFFTDFDWRIGVLNGRAIFACRYLMARNHWQIYNHKLKRFFSGGFETLPTFEVPKIVLDVAIKATSIIGKGLYGVDIKQKGQQAYVIEVNDNPSLESKVEDMYLGNELYMLIMTEFYQRLEQRGR